VLLETYRRPKQLISLTPLIDVVFILLLFFMLSSTFNRTKEISVSASSGGQANQESTTVKVLITEPGVVRIKGYEYPINSAALNNELQAYAKSGDKIYLASLNHIKVQEIIKMLDMSKTYGISNLSLSESVSP